MSKNFDTGLSLYSSILQVQKTAYKQEQKKNITLIETLNNLDKPAGAKQTLAANNAVSSGVFSNIIKIFTNQKDDEPDFDNLTLDNIDEHIDKARNAVIKDIEFEAVLFKKSKPEAADYDLKALEEYAAYTAA